MKTAEIWQEELAGETSLESIRMIQRDAMLSACSRFVEEYHSAQREGIQDALECAAFEVREAVKRI